MAIFAILGVNLNIGGCAICKALNECVDIVFPSNDPFKVIAVDIQLKYILDLCSKQKGNRAYSLIDV